MQAYSVYAPVKQANFTQFEPLNGENISDLDIFDTSSNTRIPPKALFLPMSETLMRYRKDGRVQSTAITQEKRIVFGAPLRRPGDCPAGHNIYQCGVQRPLLGSSPEKHINHWFGL